MRKQLKKTLVILVTILFVATFTSASVGAADLVKTGKDCHKFNHGYHIGSKQGYQQGFTDWKNCKPARKFPMISYTCSSGYKGGYFTGYRAGYFKGYDKGKKFCHHLSPSKQKSSLENNQ